MLRIAEGRYVRRPRAVGHDWLRSCLPTMERNIGYSLELGLKPEILQVDSANRERAKVCHNNQQLETLLSRRCWHHLKADALSHEMNAKMRGTEAPMDFQFTSRPNTKPVWASNGASTSAEPSTPRKRTSTYTTRYCVSLLIYAYIRNTRRCSIPSPAFPIYIAPAELW